MLDKIKYQFNYYKRWKHQKNRNKNLTKKINRLTAGIKEDLKLDITNEEIRKLQRQVTRQNNRIRKLELECQKYFDMLMDSLEKGDEE